MVRALCTHVSSYYRDGRPTLTDHKYTMCTPENRGTYCMFREKFFNQENNTIVWWSSSAPKKLQWSVSHPGKGTPSRNRLATNTTSASARKTTVEPITDFADPKKGILQKRLAQAFLQNPIVS